MTNKVEGAIMKRKIYFFSFLWKLSNKLRAKQFLKFTYKIFV